MASLPPRPGSPSRPRDEHSPRRARPMPDPPRRLLDRLDPPARSLPRGGPPPTDSYVAEYDRGRGRRGDFGRRAPDVDRRGRDHGWPDRRDRAPPLPPRRSPEPFDRDRRPPPPHFDVVRGRERDRDWVSDRGRPPHWEDRRPPPDRLPRRSSRSPVFRRSRSPQPLRRSRSPPLRRSRSPPPRRRGSPQRRPLSPRARSRSPLPPAKRTKLGPHATGTAPRSPSPARRGGWPPPRTVERSPARRSPAQAKSRVQSPTPKIKDEESPEPGMIVEDGEHPPQRRPSPTSAIKHESITIKPEPLVVKTQLSVIETESAATSLKTEPASPVLSPKNKLAPKVEDVPAIKEAHSPLAYHRPAAAERKPDVQMPMAMRGTSPPRQPRVRSGRGGMHTRSPPRGPRSDRDRDRGFPSRGRGGRRGLPSQAASYSAGASTYPSGPSAPPTPATPTIESKLPLPVPEKKEPEVLLPPIPQWDVRDPERSELAAALNSGRTHRAGLRTQFTTIEKATRRALQELEVATIELRGMEGRRRVADVQLEKARQGALGIEYIPPLADIVSS